MSEPEPDPHLSWRQLHQDERQTPSLIHRQAYSDLLFLLCHCRTPFNVLELPRPDDARATAVIYYSTRRASNVASRNLINSYTRSLEQNLIAPAMVRCHCRCPI